MVLAQVDVEYREVCVINTAEHCARVTYVCHIEHVFVQKADACCRAWGGEYHGGSIPVLLLAAKKMSAKAESAARKALQSASHTSSLLAP